VASWQELPSSPAQWKANTNYKVTTTKNISSNASLPENAVICIASNGALNMSKSTLTCGNNTAIYVVGGKLNLSTSTIKTGNGFIFTEGELGTINLQSSTINLGKNSIFTINGKAINGTNSTIEANSATFVAPIKKVFSQGINVTGKWIMDRAYPQWFEDNSNANWANAINKAIMMKGTGEVFLPRGRYSITSSIYVNFGIKLVGEAGRENSGNNTNCTVITPSKTSKAKFNGSYMMLVNVKHQESNGKEFEVSQESATWDVHYPNAGTMLQNLTFTCEGSKRYKGILICGGVIIDQLTWNGCLQAVAAANNTYDDQRIITNCSFYPAGNIKMQGREVLYAFDMNSLGDALVFTGNAVHNYDNYTKALRLFLCDGGNISANVLNADVLIDRCKGISFSSNHCEYGATITIQASTVVNNSNYYEKGENPSVIVTNTTGQQNSTVVINGDQFVYLNGKRSLVNGGVESVEQAAARLMSISDYDIAIDSKTQLSLNNVFRYDVPMKIGIDIQNMFGVNVANINNKGKFESNKSFNRYSHQLSKSGKINKSNKTEKLSSNMSPGKSRIYLYGKATATWLGETGDYSYSFEILDDNGRVTNKSNSLSSYTENRSTIHLEKGGDGILLCLTDTGEAGKNVYLKMKRRGADGIKTVELPITGSEHIYDNGISVSGYKWK